MDTKLLIELFKIGNSSGNEAGISEFIKKYFDSMGIYYKQDSFGNIYNLEDESLPILNAHMDSVQNDIDEQLNKFIRIRDGILSGYGVIGGDDKCGIYAILEVLKTTKVNFILTIGEEIGCQGINSFMMNNDLSNFPYALTLDRYGSGDIICHYNEYGVKEFEEAIHKIGRPYGFSPAKGVYSDADYLNEDLSCANISVGYYAHHTKNEYVVLSDLENSINYIKDVVTNLKTKFDSPDKKLIYGLYDYDYLYGESADEKCLVTGKKEKNLVYIPSLDSFLSPKGAISLYEDLEQSGLLFESYHEFNSDYDEELSSNDIDELLREIG